MFVLEEVVNIPPSIAMTWIHALLIPVMPLWDVNIPQIHAMMAILAPTMFAILLMEFAQMSQ